MISSNPTLVSSSNVIFEEATGGQCRARITPSLNKYGTATITIIMTDSGGLTDLDDFTLTVNGIEDAPIAYNISPIGFYEDVQSIITLNYSDAEGNLATSCTLTSLTNVSISFPSMS